MDEKERIMSRARALWRASKAGERIKSLWRFENWAAEPKEDHHIGRAKYHPTVMSIPVSMHRELTRRQMEEHPPEGPDPSHPLERKGRLALGVADLLECLADGLRAIGEKRVKAAMDGARELDDEADIPAEFAGFMRLLSGRLLEMALSRALDMKG